MKHANPLMVDIDKIKILQLLQNEMRRIIQNIGTRMVINFLQKSFKSQPIMEIFARMQFVTYIHTMFIKQIQNRDRKSTRLNSSHVAISYAVFCLKKKTKT